MPINLISCNNCAVALDVEKLNFPHESRLIKDDGSVDTDNFTRDGDKYLPSVICPVCGEIILKEE